MLKSGNFRVDAELSILDKNGFNSEKFIVFETLNNLPYRTEEGDFMEEYLNQKYTIYKHAYKKLKEIYPSAWISILKIYKLTDFEDIKD